MNIEDELKKAISENLKIDGGVESIFSTFSAIGKVAGDFFISAKDELWENIKKIDGVDKVLKLVSSDKSSDDTPKTEGEKASGNASEKSFDLDGIYNSVYEKVKGYVSDVVKEIDFAQLFSGLLTETGILDSSSPLGKLIGSIFNKEYFENVFSDLASSGLSGLPSSFEKIFTGLFNKERFAGIFTELGNAEFLQSSPIGKLVAGLVSKSAGAITDADPAAKLAENFSLKSIFSQGGLLTMGLEAFGISIPNLDKVLGYGEGNEGGLLSNVPSPLRGVAEDLIGSAKESLQESVPGQLVLSLFGSSQPASTNVKVENNYTLEGGGSDFTSKIDDSQRDIWRTLAVNYGNSGILA